MATIDVKDAANVTQAIEKPLAPGRAAAASSRPIALSTEDKTALDAVVTSAQLIDDGVATVASAIPTKGMVAIGTDGTNARAIKTDSSGELQIDVITLPPIPTGTNSIGKIKVTNDAGTVIDPVASISGGVPVVNSSGKYETAAASQTDQSLGATGATSDYIAGILVIPGTTSPGAVLIKDGAGSAITVFTGGASSVSNLVPFYIPLGYVSLSGAWKVTTGTNVTCIAHGNFT